MALKKSSKTSKSPFRDGAKTKTKTKPKVAGKKAPAKKGSKTKDAPGKGKALAFSLQKSASGKIRTSIEEYGDSMHLSIRHYYKSKDGEWLPTKKGTTIPLEMSLKFSRLLRKLIGRAAEAGHEVSEDEDVE